MTRHPAAGNESLGQTPSPYPGWLTSRVPGLASLYSPLFPHPAAGASLRFSTGSGATAVLRPPPTPRPCARSDLPSRPNLNLVSPAIVLPRMASPVARRTNQRNSRDNSPDRDHCLCLAVGKAGFTRRNVAVVEVNLGAPLIWRTVGLQALGLPHHRTHLLAEQTQFTGHCARIGARCMAFTSRLGAREPGFALCSCQT